MLCIALDRQQPLQRWKQRTHDIVVVTLSWIWRACYSQLVRSTTVAGRDKIRLQVMPTPYDKYRRLKPCEYNPTAWTRLGFGGCSRDLWVACAAAGIDSRQLIVSLDIQRNWIQRQDLMVVHWQQSSAILANNAAHCGNSYTTRDQRCAYPVVGSDPQ